MADISVVMDKLQGFETADDLANFFRGYGIKAEPLSAHSCAISQFVQIETGLNVITNTLGVCIEDENNEQSYPHTDAMKLFVSKYDRGYYRDLVAEGFEIQDVEPVYISGCACANCTDTTINS